MWIAILSSHSIQYHAPLFRKTAEQSEIEDLSSGIFDVLTNPSYADAISAKLACYGVERAG